jgi:hypothetical protein
MCGGIQIPNWCRRKTEWTHLEDIIFHQNQGRKTVDLIIGSDHPELTLALEERMGNPGEPIARKTPLGWTCTGILEQRSNTNHVITCCGHVMKGDSLEEQFKLLWNMDILEPNLAKCMTPDENRALQQAV